MKFFINRSAKEPITDTHELLRQIERKDAAFRITQAIFFALIFVALIILLSASYRQQAENNKLLKAADTTISRLEADDKDMAKRTNDLQNHIDCIVNLFTLPNRANLTITNIQTCQLTASASGGSTGSTKSGSVSGSANTTQSSPTPTKTMATTTTPPQTTPQPQPKHPLICTLTLGFLGC